ncbi:MAG: SRPBCC family protein [Anaerolineae bacterium]
MDRNLVARASVDIDAPVDSVWRALVDPAAIKHYMFGTDVVSDWREGSPIVWRGEWQGRPYEDKGIITRLQPGREVQYTHYSPLSGAPDVPESYHTITIELSNAGTQTHVTLSQDRNATEDERAHSEQNWQMVLDELKNFVEQQAR